VIAPGFREGKDMGNILAFRPRKPSSARAPKRNPSPATIIIFPGVRYERLTAEGSAKWAPSSWMGQLQQPLPTN
jgi:hypothetical protein